MNVTNALRAKLAVIALLVLSGCGLAISDEERLQRADVQIAAGAYRAAIIELKNVLANDSENVRARLLLAEVSLGLGDLATAEKEMSRAAEYGAAESTVRQLNLRILAAKGAYSEILAALGMQSGGLTQTEQLAFRGQALLGLGNFEEAAQTYRDWLALEPNSADAAIGSAKTLASMGDTAGAIAILQETIASNASHVDALYVLGSIYARTGNYADGEESLILALENSAPQKNIQRHVVINAELVSSQLALGKTEDARSSLARLSTIVPQSPMTLLLAARLARMEHDYALAARHLQMLLNISPDNLQAQLFLANVQMVQGNYAQAEVLLNRVVLMSPGNIQARKLLAQTQVRQAQPQGAIEALAPLIERSEEDADVYNLLAQISMQQGDSRSVLRNLRAASEASPNDTEISLNLVAAYLEVAEFDLAAQVLADVPENGSDNNRRQLLQLAVFRAQNKTADANRYVATLLEQYPHESRIALIVSSHFASIGNVALAKQVVVDFVAQNADDEQALLALGRLELSEDKLDLAEARFLKVQSIDAENLHAMLGLARIAELRGDDEKTHAILEEAAALHAGALAPRVWLATIYLASGRPADAESMVNEVTAIGYQNAKVSEIVGRVLIEVDRLDEAIVQFEVAARLDPGSALIQINAARAYVAADRTVDARAALNKALELRPGWVPAKSMLALVELRQGQALEAQRHVAELRNANPDDVSVMVLEGEIHLYQGDFANAAAAFNQAVRRGAGRRAALREFQARVTGEMSEPEAGLVSWLGSNPDDLITRTTLAQYYLQTRNGDKAIEEFEAVVRQQPDNAPVLNNLAWQYQQVGELEKALDAATRAFNLNSESGAIADTLGWIYRDLGQLERSRKLLSDAARLSPENGEIGYHLAAVLADSGDKDEARRILEELIARDSQFPSRAAAEALLGGL